MTNGIASGETEREAQRVAAACRFTAKGVHRAIREQLDQARARSPDVPSAELADVMIRRWQEYVTLGEYLRFPWGPRKFFAEGYWASDKLWPIDRERLHMTQRNRVGVF